MLNRRRHEEEHENHERWLITYADMITLLLALFMMLYAMSALDLKKFQSFQKAFKEGQGRNTHQLQSQGAPPEGVPAVQAAGSKDGTPNPTPSPVPPDTGPKALAQRKDLRDLKARLDALINKAGLEKDVEVTLENRGLDVSITSKVLFLPGQANLQPEGTTVLAKLTPVLSALSNPLLVEGHTDNVPISSAQYPTNWELSAARAVTVLRFVLASSTIKPTQVAEEGYADTRPKVPNTSEDNRARNRRVELVVLLPAAS